MYQCTVAEETLLQIHFAREKRENYFGQAIKHFDSLGEKIGIEI